VRSLTHIAVLLNTYSLYVKNLNDKINKNELKRALYMLFSTYGPVLDIVTTRVGANKKSMRGQAHVVYRDVQTATQGMRSLQGFELFGRDLRIAYGKGTSNIIPKLRGTFEPPVAAAPTTEQTDLQKSIFNAPPSNVSARPVENGLPAAPPVQPENVAAGTKRPREEEPDEEEEEQSDAPMDEDDDDAAMEEDSD
jgi:U2 small nuclear ribonucleoprotein B''